MLQNIGFFEIVCGCSFDVFPAFVPFSRPIRIFWSTSDHIECFLYDGGNGVA